MLSLRIGRSVGTAQLRRRYESSIRTSSPIATRRPEQLDDVVSVHDGDAILMAQKLAAHLGLAVGISSGANFLGALKVQSGLGGGAVVVTVFPDDNKKYLSTDLLRDEPVREGYLAPEIDLLSYRALKRVCNTCFEPDKDVERQWLRSA
jgi:cysteine synthase